MKHLRKDDGYVLVYVLIAFAVLSFVAVSICTTALKNLQAQQAEVARMEARYEAEGYLQQFVAEAGAIASESPFDSLEGEFGIKAAVEGALGREATEEIPVKVDVLEWNLNAEDANIALHEGNNTVDVEVTADLSTAKIVATLRIPVVVESCFVASGVEDDPETPDEDESEVKKYTYKVTGAIGYESYDISYEEVSE